MYHFHQISDANDFMMGIHFGLLSNKLFFGTMPMGCSRIHGLLADFQLERVGNLDEISLNFAIHVCSNRSFR